MSPFSDISDRRDLYRANSKVESVPKGIPIAKRRLHYFRPHTQSKVDSAATGRPCWDAAEPLHQRRQLRLLAQHSVIYSVPEKTHGNEAQTARPHMRNDERVEPCCCLQSPRPLSQCHAGTYS